MRTSDFDFDLPEACIALRPADPRHPTAYEMPTGRLRRLSDPPQHRLPCRLVAGVVVGENNGAAATQDLALGTRRHVHHRERPERAPRPERGPKPERSPRPERGERPPRPERGPRPPKKQADRPQDKEAPVKAEQPVVEEQKAVEAIDVLEIREDAKKEDLF